ncbi:MAG: sigma-54-dependent Fis family transcriptional regulator, partial [Planctomycetaceae bacterium]|nr:sigma-54-dependent Fis family transcriptional regulator [Planctomycetaceae bacterium]
MMGRSMDPDTLLRLLEINKRLAGETDLPRLLEVIMDSVIELTGAQRGFLILVEDGKVRFQTARNFGRTQVEQPELQVSQTVVRTVIQSGRPLLTDNAAQDPRFEEAASVTALRLTSILSVPLRVQERLLGALYVDNAARRAVFGEKEKETLQVFADQAAITIRALWRQRQVEEMNRALEANLERKSQELERVSRALDQTPYRHDYSEIVGRGRHMKEVLLLLDKVIDTDVPVLVQGESGTGKELIARAIHYNGPRRSGAFVPVNCGAIPASLLESEFFGHMKGSFTGAVENKKGLFQQAEGGTIFLDEIGEMDLEMQKKLLRVLQEKEVRPVGGKAAVRVNARLICATNKNLRREMEAKRFRDDLYYRVSVIPVEVPPLRDRTEDIPDLIAHFARRAAKEMSMPEKRIAPEAVELLRRWSWPGNIRELENEIRKAMALSDAEITADDLSLEIQGDRAAREPVIGAAVPGSPAPDGTLKETVERAERAAIERALEESGGNQTKAARRLGISRVWLRKKMERHGLLPASGEAP